MRGRAFLLACAAVGFLVSGRAASAVAVERIPLSDGQRPETAGFPPGVFLTLVSPSQYVARAPGRWVGPAYWPSGDAARRAESSIDWSVTLRDRSVEPDSAAAAATPRGWRDQERAGISVPHVFGRTVLGTLPGYFVLKHSDAMYETALAIPIGPRGIALVKFTFRTPETNNVPGLGENLVLGTFLASTWNRGQAFVALSGVRLEGNLPPAQVSIDASRRTRVVRGQVVDAFKHPLVGVRVVLQRRSGAAWRSVGSARTSRQGTYSLSTRGRGRYRATVTVAGTTVRSASRPFTT